jgi:cytidylate kinase
MKTETLYAIAAFVLTVFAIWLRRKVKLIQKEQDTLKRERIARDRALERVRRFEEMENRRFEKSYFLNLEQREKRKKRVLVQLCICVSIAELF